MRRDNFYRRDPSLALAGMAGMTLEERGVYNTILDLLYLTWRPVEDNRAYIAGHCGCAVQKLNPIIAKLIEKGKLQRHQEDGCWVITNPHFDDERAAVKGVGTGRKGKSDRGSVEEKSAGVGEKSDGVEQNPPLLGRESEQKQPVKPLEKSREDKKRDFSETDVSASGREPGFDVDAATWELAVKLLRNQGGLTEQKARPFIGRLLSQNRIEIRDLFSAVSGALANSTKDPQGYLTAAAAAIAKRRANTAPAKRVAFV